MMPFRSYLLGVVFISCFSFSSNKPTDAFPDSVSICGVSWPPFTHSNAEGQLVKGISIDIYTEAFRRLSISPDFNEIPWIRCELGVKSGEFDAIMDNASLPEYVHPSTPTGFYPLIAYVKKSSHLKGFTWKQMETLTVGKVRGYDYTPTISAFSKWKVLEASSEEQLVSLLEGERVDLAILDYFYGPIIIKEKNADIRALEPVIDSTPLYLDFNPKLEPIALALDKVLQTLIAEGFFDDVYNRHLGETYSNIKQKSSL